MSFGLVSRGVRAGRSHRGKRNHLNGLSAEDGVARHYASLGAEIVARRWRGRAGEIDLIVRDGTDLVFVEVKAGATFDSAARRLTEAQLGRIVSAAGEFVAVLPGGLATAMRFDLALVDGQGLVETIENVTLA